MTSRVHLHIDAQLVATHHATGRMHEINMAGTALGIERPLDDERTFVMSLDESGSASLRSGPFCQQMGSDPISEAEAQLGLPGVGHSNVCLTLCSIGHEVRHHFLELGTDPTQTVRCW